MKIVTLLGSPRCPRTASDTEYLSSRFFFPPAFLDSSFSLVLLYSPTKEYLLYLVRECSHERIINALCLSGCPCILVVIGDTGSYFLSLSLPRKKMKCLVALFRNNNKISRILSYRREPAFPLVLCS